MPNVTYVESDSIRPETRPETISERVGRAILAALATCYPSIFLCGTTGSKPFGPHATDAYGFMVESRNPEQDPLHNLLYGSKPRPLVGNLWFTNYAREATHKRWVLEVFGREHVELFRKLAEKLARQFEVDIQVRLESEKPRNESIPE